MGGVRWVFCLARDSLRSPLAILLIFTLQTIDFTIYLLYVYKCTVDPQTALVGEDSYYVIDWTVSIISYFFLCRFSYEKLIFFM